MKDLLDVTTETDFVTCGIKPKGELYQRASKWLEAFDERKARASRKKDFPLEAAFGLVQKYVKCHEYLFKPHRVEVEDWAAKALAWVLMNACLQRPLRKAIECRNQIENMAGDLELYAIALGIIREYENFCSQRAKIDMHVKAQRKILDANRKAFLIALEKRDGLFCKACGSVEKLRIDHIRPLSLGGLSALENLQLLCNLCNGSKGNRTMDYLEHMNKSRRSARK